MSAPLAPGQTKDAASSAQKIVEATVNGVVAHVDLKFAALEAAVAALNLKVDVLNNAVSSGTTAKRAVRKADGDAAPGAAAVKPKENVMLFFKRRYRESIEFRQKWDSDADTELTDTKLLNKRALAIYQALPEEDVAKLKTYQKALTSAEASSVDQVEGETLDA